MNRRDFLAAASTSGVWISSNGRLKLISVEEEKMPDHISINVHYKGGRVVRGVREPNCCTVDIINAKTQYAPNEKTQCEYRWKCENCENNIMSYISWKNFFIVIDDENPLDIKSIPEVNIRNNVFKLSYIAFGTPNMVT